MVAANVLWPIEHIEALKQYMLEDHGSHARVAALMNQRFRVGYSRNAIIGKCSRLGIAPKGRVPKPRPKPKPRARPEAAAPRRPAPSSQEAAKLRCVEVEPRHIAMIELTEQTCHWPYGDNPPLTYCGHPVFAGSYCAPHHYLSRRS